MSDFILKCNVTVTNDGKHNKELNSIYPINADGYLIPLHEYDVYVLITDKPLFILDTDTIRIQDNNYRYDPFKASLVSLIVYDESHWRIAKDREYIYTVKAVEN